jgi:hypothetical protein
MSPWANELMNTDSTGASLSKRIHTLPPQADALSLPSSPELCELLQTWARLGLATPASLRREATSLANRPLAGASAVHRYTQRSSILPPSRLLGIPAPFGNTGEHRIKERRAHHMRNPKVSRQPNVMRQ